MQFLKEMTRGIVKENPIFRLVLGMCPTLATTSSLENGLGMGLATLFVLVSSNFVISSLRHLIPAAIRIPCYIVVIATFVTVVDFLMQAFTPTLAANLGIFIPLIVVNCIVLGRAEAFASKNPVRYSVADGIGMGLGFTLALAILAATREIIGNGTLLSIPVNPATLTLAILPAGGFLTLGCILAFINHQQARTARATGKAAPAPLQLDCRNCTICLIGK